MTQGTVEAVALAPCLCGRPALLFRFYDEPTEPGAHINIDCSGCGSDACPLCLSIMRDVESQEDVDEFIAAWNTRAPALQAAQADEVERLRAENASLRAEIERLISQTVAVPRLDR